MLIFGTHPLKESLQTWCSGKGYGCRTFPWLSVPDDAPSCPDELAVLTSPDGDGSVQDALALKFLSELAVLWKDAGKKPTVHLLLQEKGTLRMLGRLGLPEDIEERFEVWPFTMEEAWADYITVRFPGLSENPYPGLDREPVTADSGQFVHLVILGCDDYAESIAVRAAQVAHFPNYRGSDNVPLRTRISIVSSDAAAFRDRMVSRYSTLFANSVYRSVDPAGKTSELHRPSWAGTHEDFVDVEWEFVCGGLHQDDVSERLSMWASDPKRQTTIVLSGPCDADNLDLALSLPEAVASHSIPVWVRQSTDILFSVGTRGNLIPFGMDDRGYDPGLPALHMSKLLNYVYFCIFSGSSVPTVFPREEVENAWKGAGGLQMRMSNVYNVMTMATKLHSLGHAIRDLGNFYALTGEETLALSRTEHNRWCVERLLAGFRPCTDEERDAIEADISLKGRYKKERKAHFDICAESELGKDEQGNDVRIYDRQLTAAIPLIVDTFIKEEGRQ